MAIISGVTVEWRLSPRIIVIPNTVTDVTIEDLQDTLLYLEATEQGMVFPYLRKTSGGEALGGGTSVGWTMELQNAQIHFAARTTPLDAGTGRTCDSTDSTGTELYVDDADFITDGVYVGCTAYNATTGDMATITKIVDQYTLQMFPLSGAGGSGWTDGDSYVVYKNPTCNIEGGNLVAVDDSATPVSINPVVPAANVQVVRTSASSATQSDSDAIQYSSYGGGVSLDITSSNSGTEYPIGNQEYPVNNLADAVSIANSKGFKALFIRSSMTGVNQIDNGIDISGFTIQGQSSASTTIEISSLSVCNNVNVRDCNVFGTLDGGTSLTNCLVGDIVYFNGHIDDCGLYGTIYLDGNEEAVLNNCYTYDQDSPCIVDMGGTGQDLAMPNYSGLVTVKNLSSGTEEIGIGLNSGLVILDSTVTAGAIIVSGVGILQDNSGGTASVNTDGLMNKSQIASSVWDEDIGDHLINNTMGHAIYHMEYNDMVTIDTVNGTSGTAFPIGTEESPVDNLSDALTICSAHNFNNIHVHGNLTIAGEDITDYTFTSDRSLGNAVTITSMINTDACYFENLTVSGALSGSTRFTTCVLGALTGFDGGAKDSLLTGDITVTGSGANYFTNCDTYVTDSTYKTITVGSNLLNIIRCRGSIEIAGFTGSATLALDFTAGNCKIASSCVSGVIVVSGLTSLTDESGAGCIVIDGTLTESNIVDKVWDESIADHTDTGSVGEALDNVSAGASPSAIADAVWDEDLSTHTTAGTAGLSVQKILGMTLENHVEDDINRDANGNKTSSLIYCYDSAANATTHDKTTGIIAKYAVTGHFDANNRVTSFSVILQ